MVGDGEVAQAGLRRSAAVLHHPLVDVAELGVPELGQGRVDGVCGQQRAVVAEVIAAAAGVRDDRVELRRREEVDHPLGQRLGRIAFAVVGVERAAAGLDGRRVDFTAVGQKDVGGVTIDIREDEVLDAAGQQGDAVRLLRRRFDRADQLRRELRRDGRALGFEAAEVLGQQLGQSDLAGGGLQPEALVKPEQASGEAEQARAHEQPADGDRAPEAAGEGLVEAGGLDFGAGGLEQVGVIHARGAGGLAGQAAEAVAHLIGEGRRELQFVVGHGAHERDASAWAVALLLGGVVGGAGRQAHPAMHALLQDRVIEELERRLHPSVEDLAGVEQVARIPGALDLAHEVVAVLADLAA